MTKFAQNVTQKNPAINNIHKVRKSFPKKKIEMREHFEIPCNEPKNVTLKLKILKSKFENLK